RICASSASFIFKASFEIIGKVGACAALGGELTVSLFESALPDGCCFSILGEAPFAGVRKKIGRMKSPSSAFAALFPPATLLHLAADVEYRRTRPLLA